MQNFGGDTGPWSIIEVDFKDALYPHDCREVVDGCVVQRCVSYSSHQPYPKALHAGLGRVSGAGVTSECTLYDGWCSFTNGPYDRWPIGTKLDVSFDGDELPPFAASVAVPPSVTVTSPSAPTNGPLTVDPANDLIVQWAPIEGSTVALRITQGGTRMVKEIRDDLDIAIECRFASSSGVGAIPKAALGMLDPTEAWLDVHTISEQTVASAGVSVRAESEHITEWLRVASTPSGFDGGTPEGCTFGNYLCDGPQSGSVCSTACPEGCWTYVSAPDLSTWGCCC